MRSENTNHFRTAESDEHPNQNRDKKADLTSHHRSGICCNRFPEWRDRDKERQWKLVCLTPYPQRMPSVPKARARMRRPKGRGVAKMRSASSASDLHPTACASKSRFHTGLDPSYFMSALLTITTRVCCGRAKPTLTRFYYCRLIFKPGV